jgi:Peptidase family S49
VCVDEVAASGGYMMAAVADTIVASDFAMLVRLAMSREDASNG